MWFWIKEMRRPRALFVRLGAEYGGRKVRTCQTKVEKRSLKGEETVKDRSSLEKPSATKYCTPVCGSAAEQKC
jgi:hypothetical protein